MLESHLRKLMVPTTDLKWNNMLSGRFRSYPNANPECDPEPLTLQLVMLQLTTILMVDAFHCCIEALKF